MKPPVFEYHAPTHIDEVLELVAQHGDEAKPLAGGQSLVPAMNFRLARPSVLIDLNGIDGLGAIALEGDELRIGAMTRQRAVERSDLVGEVTPLLSETLPFVAHPQIRNRGTVGGSLAHADPAAELPAVALALGARFFVRSQRGTRVVEADAFFDGLFSTAMEDDELLENVAFPVLADGQVTAFSEISRRHGDYALVGVAVSLSVDSSGCCERARIGLLSVGDGPVLAVRAAEVLAGEVPSDELIRSAAARAGHDDIDPPGDIHASVDYRRHLTEVLVRRTLAAAFARASNGGSA